MNRRGFLAAATSAGVAAMTGTAADAARIKAPALGLADITVQKYLTTDYAGTLKKVAAMGYRVFGFRLAGWDPRDTSERTPEDKARMVRDAGMEIGVVRLGVRGMDHERDFEAANRIGARVVAMTIAPPFLSKAGLGKTTRAAFEAWLPELTKLCEQARGTGLTLAYHNHWFDLQPLDGAVPLDLMAAAISPSLLSFEVDLAWAYYGGVAPLDLVRKLGPRVVSMHWKDIDRKRGTSITDHCVAPGSGEMDYAALLPRIAALTKATGYIEVDAPDDGLIAAESAARFVDTVFHRK